MIIRETDIYLATMKDLQLIILDKEDLHLMVIDRDKHKIYKEILILIMMVLIKDSHYKLSEKALNREYMLELEIQFLNRCQEKEDYNIIILPIKLQQKTMKEKTSHLLNTMMIL